MQKCFYLFAILAWSGCVSRQESVGLVRIEDLDRPPKPVFQPPAEYIEVWSRSRIDAQASVEFTIQEDGAVSDAAVLRETNSDIGLAAVAAVKKWRFAPPTCRGFPARVRLATLLSGKLIDMKFVMPKEESNQASEPTSGLAPGRGSL